MSNCRKLCMCERRSCGSGTSAGNISIHSQLSEKSSVQYSLSNAAKGYAEQFAGLDVYLLGVEFSSLERNIVRFEWRRAE